MKPKTTKIMKPIKTKTKNINYSKNLNLILGLTLVCIIAFSCKKYPEGPTISFRSKTERISNSWHIKQIFENGVDKTNDFNNMFQNYVITIRKDLSYNISYKFIGLIDYNESGVWSFNTDKTGITFKNNANNNTSNWKILKLMEKELWGKYLDSNKTIEVHLIP